MNHHSTTLFFKRSQLVIFLTVMLLAFVINNLLIFKAFAQTPVTQLQDHKTLYNLALQHLKQKVDQQLFNPKFNIQKISKHLKLKQCLTEPYIEDKAPENITGRNTLRVICEQPKWKVFLSTTTDGDLPVVISTQGILKQAVIKVEDVKQVLMPYKKVKRDSFQHSQKLIGMRAKRAIGPNRVITVRMVEPPYWVFKNKEVEIITSIGGIQIKTKGIALQSGVEQQQIVVKNLSSKKNIKGIVVAPNRVWVP